MKHNRHNEGFTLIEVLIALMILAIALTAVVLASQNSIRNTDHVKNKLAAHWIAMNVIARMQAGMLASPNGEQNSGEAHMLGQAFNWTAGLDQQGNGFYARIYVDVTRKGSTIKLEHLIGFIKKRHSGVNKNNV